MTKIVSIVGARPQFIKAAVVSRALRRMPGVAEVLVHTGQHYDENMSAVFFEELDITPPHHHLGIGSGPHGAQTGRMIEAIERVLLAEQPAWVLLYGDTNSTLAGAVAAAKLRLPVAHVEAGLRSFNRAMPEEVNRVLADHCSSLLLAPTENAVRNLQREGLPQTAIRLVGDVMYDAALAYGELASRQGALLCQLGLSPRSYLLATVHRSENTDETARLRAILEGLSLVSQRMPVVLPLHPRAKGAIQRLNGTLDLGQVRLLPPAGYLEMLLLEKNACVIATDSGGVQKEAFFYRIPCVTLRNETEWVELVELGWNRLAPPQAPEAIARAITAAVDSRGTEAQPYGDGHAAERIAGILASS